MHWKARGFLFTRKRQEWPAARSEHRQVRILGLCLPESLAHALSFGSRLRTGRTQCAASSQKGRDANQPSGSGDCRRTRYPGTSSVRERALCHVSRRLHRSFIEGYWDEMRWHRRGLAGISGPAVHGPLLRWAATWKLSSYFLGGCSRCALGQIGRNNAVDGLMIQRINGKHMP